MSTFATPGPITLVLRLAVGDVRVAAEQTTETVVTVLPRDDAKAEDRSAAEQTRVELAQGRLVIEAPRKRGLFGDAGAVSVTVSVPAGSRVEGRSDMGGFFSAGQLGDCAYSTEYGEIQLDHADRLELSSGYGDITVGRATGQASIKAGSGIVLVGSAHGALELHNTNGRTQVTEVNGSVRASSTNGDIVLGTAHHNITAHSHNGSIRIDRGIRGRFDLRTAAGEVRIGVSRDARAWLDVQTKSKTGRVRNDLGAAQARVRSDADIELHAVTSSGDIVVHPA